MKLLDDWPDLLAAAVCFALAAAAVARVLVLWGVK